MKEKTSYLSEEVCRSCDVEKCERKYASVIYWYKKRKNNRKPGTTVLLKNSKATDKTGGFSWISCETVSWAQVVSTQFQSE